MKRFLAPLALVIAGTGCAKGLPFPAATTQVPIPAGTYVLGRTVADSDPCAMAGNLCAASQVPHPVTISRMFQIDRTEVTNLQYAAYAAKEDGQGCGFDGLDDAYQKRPDRPVEVTISRARAYCAWRGLRLPTAAEWEVAARVGPGGAWHRFPWGDQPLASCDMVPGAGPGCPTNQDSYDVGTKPTDKTGLDVYDMAGNVREWVEDDFSAVQDCFLGMPLHEYCQGDEAGCRQAYCSDPAGCSASTSCQINSGCGQPGTLPMCAAAMEPAIDPYYVSSNRGQNYCNSPSSNTATAKGGGVQQAQCAQDPALKFSISSNGGSGPGNNSSQQGATLGFRCVTGPILMPPTITGSITFNDNGMLCRVGQGVVRIAKNTPPPSGWGSSIQVWLATSTGAIRGTWDGAGGYVLDWTALCQGRVNQQLNGVLAFVHSPRENYNVEVSATLPVLNCTMTFKGTISLIGQTGDCGGSGGGGLVQDGPGCR